METSSDGGTGAQEKQVTVAYDGGGLQKGAEERDDDMGHIYMYKRGGRQDATAGWRPRQAQDR